MQTKLQTDQDFCHSISSKNPSKNVLAYKTNKRYSHGNYAKGVIFECLFKLHFVTSITNKSHKKCLWKVQKVSVIKCIKCGKTVKVSKTATKNIISKNIIIQENTWIYFLQINNSKWKIKFSLQWWNLTKRWT